MNILQDPKQRIDFGNTLYAQGKYDEAIQKYQEACEINPNSSQGYYNWGNALRRQGKLDEAIAKYRKSLEINPNISQAYNNWGLALCDQKKYDEAILKYTKAIEINPSFSQAFNNWGLALDARGDYEEAILKYKKATEFNPRYSEAYYNWGNVLFALEEYDMAAGKYSHAIELNPRYSQAYHNWGVVLSAKEEYEQAIQKYNKAIEIDPYYSDAYNNWALILYDQKKYTEAVQIVAKGVKALSNHPENKIELIKLFNNEMKQDEQELSGPKTDDQKADLRSKMASIKQILDVLIEQPRPSEPYKEPVVENRVPSPNKLTSPLEKKEMSDSFQPNAQSNAQPNAAIGTDPRVIEYYNFMVQEMTVLFGKTFAVKDGKFEEKTDMVLPCVAFAASFVPALYDVSFDEKIFPLVSKIAPDGISLEDVFIIRKVNKIYQQFMTHFTSQDEMKQIIESLARELTIVRKDSLIADYAKPVHAKTLLKLKQAMARDFVKKYQVNSKSEEAAVLDLGIIVVLFFLEGLRVEEYSNPTQKANNIAKTVSRIIKEFHDELKNEGKVASEWCNVM